MVVYRVKEILNFQAGGFLTGLLAIFLCLGPVVNAGQAFTITHLPCGTVSNQVLTLPFNKLTHAVGQGLGQLTPVTLNLPCGSYGAFVFTEAEAIPTGVQLGLLGTNKGCVGIPTSGDDETKVFARPTEDRYTPPDWSLSLEPWFGDEMNWNFATPGPWVAIVDWSNWHGDTVAWTIRLLSGEQVNVVRFPLDDPDLGIDLSALFPEVGDAHLLAQLCNLVEKLESPSGPQPPLVLNMSFGRLAEPEDYQPCLNDESSLSCQIKRVLGHLKGMGVAPVAAAGNHLQNLVPASYGNVTSVGSLNLHTYAGASLSAQSYWQNPANVDALLPGNAICFQSSIRLSPLQVPAGSSFAAAFFSGWVTAHLQAVPGPLSGFWTPIYSDGGYMLAKNGQAMPHSAMPLVAELFDRMSEPQNQCWTWPDSISDALVLTPDYDNPVVLGPSFPEILQSHGPTPEVNPCIPCMGNGGYDNGLKADGSLLVMDLSADDPLPAELEVLEVCLWVNGKAFPLKPRLGTKAEFLSSLEMAQLNTIAILDPLEKLGPDKGLSLVFKISYLGNTFWHGAPIHVPFLTNFPSSGAPQSSGR